MMCGGPGDSDFADDNENENVLNPALNRALRSRIET